MLNRIFKIIEPAGNGDKASKIYDVAMIIIIVTGLIPLAFKQQTANLIVVDKVCLIIFIIDYVLRFITANLKLHKGTVSFIIYPFTPWAIVDLLSILPSFSVISNGFRVLRVMRLLRSARVFRAFKKQSGPLITVCMLALGYILISALVIFNVEPDSFDSFFEAVYWATVSLTTMGYGDIYPVTTAGRIITMISAIFGIAIIALPAGIITAGYMEEIGKSNE